MGVNPTPSNFKTFTFDNTNSAQYGVYITGQGVFNAPERNVEMVGIPGRNGAYALDKGNFNNIEVTYPAGIVADTEADFATAVSNLRNFLCSKTGYCRLTDDYNSGEYRMAIYKSGLEVDHEGLKTGEFNIVFECKPQRWLTSGETAVSVASGGKVTNPTLFDARPQLQVWGYGDIDLGGQEISILNVPLGEIVVQGESSQQNVSTLSITFNDELINNGDTITVGGASHVGAINAMYDQVSVSTSVSGDGTCIATLRTAAGSTKWCDYTITLNSSNFVYGTASTETVTATIVLTQKTTLTTHTCTSTLSLAYDGSNGFTLTCSYNIPAFYAYVSKSSAIGLITADSTVQSLTGPIYVDLDIGEAYVVDNGVASSVNNVAIIPAELPTLPSGDTTITYDNTITQFKVLPRWWKV